MLLYPPVKQVEAKTKNVLGLSKEGDEHVAPTFTLDVGTGTFLLDIYTAVNWRVLVGSVVCKLSFLIPEQKSDICLRKVG